MSDPVAILSWDDFLALEDSGGARHEYVRAQAFLMSSGTERHDLTVARLMQLIGAEAFARGCRAFDGNRLLRSPTGAAYYPDLMVACGRAADEHFEDDAVLVAEVLSQSTRGLDRREKLDAYARLPSLQAYVLVEPTIRKIDVATIAAAEREPSWEVYGPVSVVNLAYAAVDLDALDDWVEAHSTT
jgi:Uma2 family endonuclease